MVIGHREQFLFTFDEPSFLFEGGTDVTITIGTGGKNDVFTATILTQYPSTT